MATTREALDALQPEDCDILAAAAAGLLTSDSRFVGTINELRYRHKPDQLDSSRVPMRQHRRLRDTLHLIKPSADVQEKGPTRPGMNCGYTLTTMQLTPQGLAVLAALVEGKKPVSS